MYPFGNELLAKVFQKRGYDPNFLLDIDCAEHGELTHARELCAKLRDVCLSGEEIVFLPDFDMDGIMSGVIGLAGLRELGFNSNLFVPDPRDGYGFTAQTIERLVAIYPNVKHIITGDVGITCFEGVDEAVKRGIKVYITDHHQQAANLPNAEVIVDPMCEDSTYIHPQICGAFVIYQCLSLYAQMYCDRMTQERIHRLRVFAGIGTVTDRMPLLYENRQLVRDSLAISKFLYCNGDSAAVDSITGCPAYVNAFKGLYQTYLAFHDANKLDNPDVIDEDFYGFYLGPAFNSIKRLDGDMHAAWNVFFDVNPVESVQYMIQLNDERKGTVEDSLRELMDSHQPYAPYAYVVDAPSGVLGLLAQKIMGMTKMPCLVLRETEDGRLRGSGRSPEWCDFSAIARPAGGFFAGHKGAFGCHFENSNELESVLAVASKAIDELLKTVDISEQPDVFIDDVYGQGDSELDVVELTDFVETVSQYKPFGMGFAAPTIKVQCKVKDCTFKCIGSEDQHVKVYLPHGVEALCWNQSMKLGDLEHSDVFSITGTFEIIC